jgi:predicted transcriptional regulator
MKTTIEISDVLVRAVKRMAAERDTTLRAIVETALRRYLEAASNPADAPRRLRRHTFRGRGLQPGLSESDWAAIRERAYERRGGSDPLTADRTASSENQNKAAACARARS